MSDLSPCDLLLDWIFGRNTTAGSRGGSGSTFHSAEGDVLYQVGAMGVKLRSEEGEGRVQVEEGAEEGTTLFNTAVYTPAYRWTSSVTNRHFLGCNITQYNRNSNSP